MIMCFLKLCVNMVENECAYGFFNTQDSRDFSVLHRYMKLYYGAAQDQNSVSYSVAIHTDSLLMWS